MVENTNRLDFTSRFIEDTKKTKGFVISGFRGRPQLVAFQRGRSTSC